ncbi:hypothetical protein FRC02_006891, partial [Tulasnella sp. 418]
YIDDAFEGTIDSYADSSKPIYDLKLFEATNLTYTEHELKLILVRNSTQWDPSEFIPGCLVFNEIQYTVPDTIPATSH